MTVLPESATVEEKARWVIEQADDPRVRKALYRRLVQRLDKAEHAVADAQAELEAFVTTIEIAFGEKLRKRSA